MRLLTSILVLCMLFSVASSAQAGQLTDRSDTLGTSGIGLESSHRIIFKPGLTIPSSGTITITPTPGQFSVHSQLDYRDVDILVNSAEQHVASTPGSGSGSAIGAIATSGSNGTIVLTLNDTDAITSGSTIEILIGSIASYEATGLYGITNPNTVGSYPITIGTTNASSTPLDSSVIGIATTVPVGVSGTSYGTITASPTFSPNPGTYANSVAVTLSTTTPGATIYYTTNGSTPTTGSTVYTGALTINQSTVVQALATAPGYTDSAVSSATYTITTTSGGGGGGSVVIPPFTLQAGETTINGGVGGIAYGGCGNGSTITLTIPAGAWNGTGYVALSCLPYSTFENKNGAASGDALADTIFGISITNNSHRPITTSQSPIAAVIAYTQGQYLGFSDPFTTQQFSNSRWNKLTYIQNQNTPTVFSTAFTTIGSLAVIGLAKNQNCSDRKADLNCDMRVDLVDFSILLYWWNSKQSGIRADINKDGIVNLIDLSILFYWWTG